jgi:hypothetical protein
MAGKDEWLSIAERTIPIALLTENDGVNGLTTETRS